MDCGYIGKERDEQQQGEKDVEEIRDISRRFNLGISEAIKTSFGRGRGNALQHINECYERYITDKIFRADMDKEFAECQTRELETSNKEDQCQESGGDGIEK